MRWFHGNFWKNGNRKIRNFHTLPLMVVMIKLDFSLSSSIKDKIAMSLRKHLHFFLKTKWKTLDLTMWNTSLTVIFFYVNLVCFNHFKRMKKCKKNSSSPPKNFNLCFKVNFELLQNGGLLKFDLRNRQLFSPLLHASKSW